MYWKIHVMALLAAGVVAGSAASQEPEPNLFLSGGVGGAAFQTRPGMVAMHFEGMDAAPVKGAPFCATVVTEHTQSLADGNRIHTSDSSMLCRDGEGRTRREAGLNLLGAGATQQTSAPKLITTTDPAAGVRYLLDTENKIAQKMPLPADGGFGPGGGAA